ncbi:CerR family C-terminal domain-containing protein [Marimonas arenosa]|uniref:CerR family C-terminal domain-containing protein n=1 Tax=Marimonas arenosa TaxID=1795305 RepID=A0AAE4B5B5_9RHOB|nr:CerR family C-terminal domain-containing protein [Marimonas arenosa]MDQ2091145.1 CerR family C-terminal domain-containing protein [Marimonas arenosa]
MAADRVGNRPLLDSIKRLNNTAYMTESNLLPDTRTRLIAAGLHLFGRGGFDGTSTRELARRAETNVASIAYHFGGKAGLRQACAESIAHRVSSRMSLADADALPQDPQAALSEIEDTLRQFATMLYSAPEAEDFVPFLLRELTEPGEIAELIFTRLLLPRHVRLCRLWALATGRPAEADAVKLAVFAAIGQLLYFRIARPLVTRRMNWPGIGPDETAQITETVIANLRAAIERSRT